MTRVEQKVWTHVCELVGYLRQDTDAELSVLNEIWERDRTFTNYLLLQQKLVFTQPAGARHHTATTPHRRVLAWPGVCKMPIIRMNTEYKTLKPAVFSRYILTFTGLLETLAKGRAGQKPAFTVIPTAENSK